MDIYNFIENEEQREYLLNKHYEFTAVEAAYVVCNSNRAINEKHDAIDYIINNYEDCEMVKECQTEYSSTLDYLKEYNKIIEKYYSKMFSDSDESEYSLQVWYIGCAPEEWIGGLRTFEEVLDELGFYSQEEEFTFKIRREWVDEYVELDHNPDGKPYKILFKGTPEEQRLISAIEKVDVKFLNA